MRSRFKTTDQTILARIGKFLANAADLDGGRKERKERSTLSLSRQQPSSSAIVDEESASQSAASQSVSDSDNDSGTEEDIRPVKRGCKK